MSSAGWTRATPSRWPGPRRGWRTADLDIYLGEKDCWGRGYATDTMRTICRYGFEKMRLHKIALELR